MDMAGPFIIRMMCGSTKQFVKVDSKESENLDFNDFVRAAATSFNFEGKEFERFEDENGFGISQEIFFDVLNACQPLSKFCIKVVLKSGLPEAQTQKFEISTKIAENSIDTDESNPATTQHPKASSIKNSVSLEEPHSPNTNTRKQLGKLVLDTPLTKRCRLENNGDIEADTFRDGEQAIRELAVNVQGRPKESTQVQVFRKSIQKCREECRYSPEEIIEIDSETDNDEEGEQIQPSQPGEVDWRDPDDLNRSDRFRRKFNGKRCFSMSLTPDDEPQILKDQILKLGGTVCEDLLAFPSCTHLICSIPNSSEKTMSAVASGRWLLCPSYIVDSFKADRFLNEEEYEWGNPKAKSRLPVTNDAKANKIAMISHKLRKKLLLRSKQENRPVGIFSNFRVILHSEKKEAFKRLLEAGLGVVVDIKEPYSEQKHLLGVTHCLVDTKMKKLSNTDKEALNKAGVHCVNMLYLRACLCEDSMPNLNDYVIKQ